MRIQHNIAALNSYRQLGGNNNAVSKNLEKLSSGYRINRAGDDAAGLAISEKMRAQITGLETAQKNSNDGISLVQTAEGALTEVHSMLNRMVELADQSANGTYDDAVDRANLQKEIESLSSEIDRIAEGTNFNGIKLLNGDLDGKETFSKSGTVYSTAVTFTAEKAGVTLNIVVNSTVESISVKQAGDTITLTLGSKNDGVYTQEEINEALKAAGVSGSVSIDGGSITTQSKTDQNVNLKTDTVPAPGKALELQIGDTAEAFNQIQVNIGSMSTTSLGLDGIDISSQAGAKEALAAIKAAINTVSSTRGDLGAIQNRLEHTINNLGVTAENMTAAESRIRDVDMAEEMMAYTKNNILVQASQSMLAQANQQPQGVLQLLQ